MTPPLTINSRYNPRAEADRYAASLAIDEKKIKYLLLIEPGLGYLAAALSRRCPAAKIVTLHAVPGWGSDAGDAAWEPGGESLRTFLEREIADTTAAGIRLVEWRPAQAACGEAYVKVLAAAAEFIRLADANARTTKLFGRRWVRNFFKNIALAKKLVFFRNVTKPIVVCAAGPSLEDDVDFIAKNRGGLFIIAASSAAMALYAAGVTPDLFVACDGGTWALLHLWEALRPCNTPRNTHTVIAASLTAALPSQCDGFPLLPIDDGSLWQKMVLDGVGLPRVSSPQRGTVAASALDLAFLLGAGHAATAAEVFTSGIDFRNRDLATHARPYAFDRLQREAADRFNPCYSRCFTRERAARQGGSYDIYSSWFGRQTWPGRVTPLSAARRLWKGAAETIYAEAPRGNMRSRGRDILLAAIRAGNKGVTAELGTLLGVSEDGAASALAAAFEDAIHE